MNNPKTRKRNAFPTLLIAIGAVIGLTAGTVAVLLTDQEGSGLRVGELKVTQSTNGNAEEEQANLYSDTLKSINDITGLVTLLDAVNRVERDRVLYNFVNTTNVKNLETLLKQSNDISSTHVRREVQKALIRSLATQDPKRILDLLEDLDDSFLLSLTGLVFQEWAVGDLDQAVAEAAELSEPKRRIAMEGILTARYDLSEIDRREIARELGHEQLVIDQIALALIDDEILDPQQAWTRFFETFGKSGQYSTAQQLAIVKIAQAWIVASGNDVLKVIDDALRVQEDYVLLVGQVLENIAKDNPHQALEIADTLDLRSLSILSRLITSATSVSPLTALDATLSIKKPETRRHLQELAITEWAKAAPLEVLNSLDQLPADIRLWGQEEALKALASESPRTAASFLSTVDNVRTKKSIASAIVYEWAKLDHNEAIQWINSNPDVSDWKESLQSQFLRGLAQHDIQLALTLALDEPITPSSTVGLEAAVIEEVANFNVDEAISLLNSARNQATRQSAYKAIGSALVVKGRSELAMELVAESSPEFQYEYFDSFRFLWAENDPEDLYEKLESLPTEKIAEHMAYTLLVLNPFFRFLTPEQKKALEKYIPAAYHPR